MSTDVKTEGMIPTAPATARPDKVKAKASATAGLADKIHTWPYLVRLEMIVATFFMVGITIWSILIDAPLEEPANPTRTPNPSKAPWYFLGLQEMLVYFDPWFAGVVLPSLIIVGLMVIPYIDINPKGNGYYCFRDRWFAITTYLFGFLILWVLLIIIGTFLRGPGWYFFAPWNYWDVHKTVAITNVDLPVLIGRWTGIHWFKTPLGVGLTGFALISAYMGVPFAWYFRKRKTSEVLQRLGFVRFAITSQLFMIMMGLVVKMLLRWTLDVKYIMATPWINV